MRHCSQEGLHEPGWVAHSPACIPECSAGGRENGCPARAIRLSKGRHLERIRVYLLSSKDAKAIQVSSCVAAKVRVAGEIHCRCGARARVRVGIVGSQTVEIKEDALSRSICQYDTVDNRPRPDKVPVEEAIEERLVTDNRSAKTERQLILVLPVRDGGTPLESLWVDIVVSVPGIGVQRTVTDAPHRGTAESVGSGAGGDLDLPVTAAHLSI